MSRTSLNRCTCGSGQPAPARYDGHMIFLAYACQRCWPAKLRTYRHDIMEWYECDEPIENET